MTNANPVVLSFHPDDLRTARSGSDLRVQLLRILAEPDLLESAFQRIVDLRDGRVIGFEALLRLPAGSGFDGPGPLFRGAAATGLLADLEIAALETHLAAARELPEGLLFLNLSAPAFLDRRLVAGSLAGLVRHAGYSPTRVVLELTELVSIGDPAEFARAVRPLRAAGFHLAVDDFGAGFSNVPLLVDLEPDYLKLDASLVTGVAADRRRRLVLEALVHLGRRLNCRVLTEGLETAEDVEAARDAGATLGQGWELGRPVPAALLRSEPPTPFLRPPLPPLASTEEVVSRLSRRIDPIDHASPTASLIARFEAEDSPPAVPVLQEGRVVGVVTPERLFFHLGHQFGFSVWRDRPLRLFIQELGLGFEALPADATLEAASEVVRKRKPSRRFDPIVVVGPEDVYEGLLTVDLLLQEMTRLKVDYAQQASPLTGLPGAAVLARRVDSLVASGRRFALGWADLDAFKPFNDRYGFARGDEVLLLAADVLRRHLQARPTDLLCHPGGDDFAFVVDPDEAEARARGAAEEFSERVPGFYDPGDRIAGFLSANDRLGIRRRFPLSALSIGIVPWSGECRIGYRELVQVAAEVKKAAKAIPGPAVVTNRRTL